MSRDLTDLPGSDEQPDPVAELFARERAEVRDLAPEAGHWDDLVREARRPAGRRWVPYAAAAAAAVVVGAVAWGGLHPERLGRTDPATASSRPTPGTVTTTSTVTVTAPVVPAPPSSSTSAPTAGTPTGPLRVPATFSLVSMTNAGGGHLYALGAAKCATGDCVQVVASDDDGRTWERRSAFTDVTTPGSRTTPDRPRQFVGIRFANPQVGYLYGSTTKRTTDGGRTWSDVDVDGRVVLSLETDGQRVWMATAGSCRHDTDAATRGCRDLEPRTGLVTSSSTTAVRYDGMPGTGENAWIAMDGSDAYYNVTSTDGFTPVPPARISGTPEPVPVPERCAEGAWVWGTANARGTLVAVCRSAAAPEKEYTVAASSDRGHTWKSRPAPGLGVPTPSGVWLTAVDAERLVVVRQGLPTSGSSDPAPTTLLVSADGGSKWRKALLEGAAGKAAAWAGAAGGGLVYAFSGGLSYLRSDDAGASFSVVPLRP